MHDDGVYAQDAEAGLLAPVLQCLPFGGVREANLSCQEGIHFLLAEIRDLLQKRVTYVVPPPERERVLLPVLPCSGEDGRFQTRFGPLLPPHLQQVVDIALQPLDAGSTGLMSAPTLLQGVDYLVVFSTRSLRADLSEPR